MKTTLLTALLFAASLVSPSHAATISFETFTPAAFASATSADSSIETFEGFARGAWNSATVTNVGAFSSVGGTGSGTVCRALVGSARCDGLGLQDGVRSGQGNIWPVNGTKALSSSDTFGIVWDAFDKTGRFFNSVVFGVRDAADIRGTTFSVTANGVTQSFTGQADGNSKLFRIAFGADVASATIRLFNTDAKGNLRVNDGFTLDGAVLNLSEPSPVPLPAALPLLLAALGGLGFVRSRKKRAV
jgi:hypothetical protein